MTPKEKAKYLVDKFYRLVEAPYDENAKDAAMIAVDEILSFVEDERDGFNWKKYYQEVKNEIELL